MCGFYKGLQEPATHRFRRKRLEKSQGQLHPPTVRIGGSLCGVEAGKRENSPTHTHTLTWWPGEVSEGSVLPGDQTWGLSLVFPVSPSPTEQHVGSFIRVSSATKEIAVTSLGDILEGAPCPGQSFQPQKASSTHHTPEMGPALQLKRAKGAPMPYLHIHRDMGSPGPAPKASWYLIGPRLCIPPAS